MSAKLLTPAMILVVTRRTTAEPDADGTFFADSGLWVREVSRHAGTVDGLVAAISAVVAERHRVRPHGGGAWLVVAAACPGPYAEAPSSPGAEPVALDLVEAIALPPPPDDASLDWWRAVVARVRETARIRAMAEFYGLS